MDIFKNKKILIVEDEETLRQPLAEEFESLGATVFQAHNGRLGYELFIQEKPDAIVSDIRMPGGDGVELMKRIKATDCEFPVLLLITGFSDLSREDAYDLGAEAILPKPFALDDVNLALARILTPKSERWQIPTDPAKIRGTIEATLTAFDDAIKNGQFSLGRGGFFLSEQTHFAGRNELIRFHIKFESGEILLLEGTGTIRWARKSDLGKLTRGYGVEFESLAQETRETVLRFTSDKKISAFIPKA